VSREVVKEVFIKAPADVVWKALTEASELTQWFSVDAKVTPGMGGAVWVSWGEGAAGEAPITGWEPDRHFQWTEHRGPVKVAIDFHLQSRDGGTVVRLVQSGFGDGPEWDDEYHMVDGGWSYFMAHLQWYLERHRGVRRDLIGFRERAALTREEAFARLVTVTSGVDTTPVMYREATCQAAFFIPSLNDALLFIEIEPGAETVRGGFWLSTYGLDPVTFERVRERFTAAYGAALPISHTPGQAAQR
jgi:uncharacterized protein YndB with AHSA1/START domain